MWLMAVALDSIEFSGLTFQVADEDSNPDLLDSQVQVLP